MSQHHYFASHGLGWASGETRDEAVTKVIGAFRQDIKGAIRNCHKAGEPGWYVWSVRVEGPSTLEYGIEWYRPVGVPILAPREHHITYVTKTASAYTNKRDEDEVLAEATVIPPTQ
jgi:hypothetical protein